MFVLPNLRGRAALNKRAGSGLSTYNLGERGCIEHVTLNLLQKSSHTHAHSFSANNGNSTVETSTVGASIATTGANDGRTFSSTLGFNSETPNTPLITA